MLQLVPGKSLGLLPSAYAQQEEIVETTAGSHVNEEFHQEQEHHDSGMEPLLFVIIALLIGAATRHFLKKSPLPFTVMLLLIGIGL